MSMNDIPVKYTTVKLPFQLVKEVQASYGTKTATEGVQKAMEQRLQDEAWKWIMSQAGKLKIRYTRREDQAKRDRWLFASPRSLRRMVLKQLG